MSIRHLARTTLIGLLSMCMVCGGCTTLHRVPMPAAPGPNTVPQLQPGDWVVVQMKSGESKEFRIAIINEQAILGVHGSGRRDGVAWTDIEQLGVRRPSKGKTAGLVGGVAGGAAAVYAVIVIVKALGKITCGYCTSD
jgi:hypothetical protein